MRDYYYYCYFYYFKNFPSITGTGFNSLLIFSMPASFLRKYYPSFVSPIFLFLFILQNQSPSPHFPPFLFVCFLNPVTLPPAPTFLSIFEFFCSFPFFFILQIVLFSKCWQFFVKYSGCMKYLASSTYLSLLGQIQMVL